MSFVHGYLLVGTLLSFYAFTVHMLCIAFILVMLSYLVRPGKFNYEIVEEPFRGNQMILRMNSNGWSQNTSLHCS